MKGGGGGGEYEAAFAPTGEGRALLVGVSPIFFVSGR